MVYGILLWERVQAFKQYKNFVLQKIAAPAIYKLRRRDTQREKEF